MALPQWSSGCRSFRQPSRVTAGRGWIFAGVLAVASGCGDVEQIRSYTVARTDPQRAPAVASRMLAAIVMHGDEAWFFKMTGPDAATALQHDAFVGLIKSLRFDPAGGGAPRWELPAGWTEHPGSSMRFATLVVESAGESVECSVSKLPVSGQSRDEYVLANINRWRGQLRLPPIGLSDLPGETTVVELADSGLQATLINIVGTAAGGGMGSAPMAGGAPRPPVSGGGPSGGRPAGVASRGPAGLKFRTPAGWSPGELEIARGGIVVRRDAAFEIRDGEQSVEITVTKLPAAAGAMLPNVNRWRGQIGLDPFTADQLEREKQPIELAGSPADYVRFDGSEQSILGVIAERDGLAWFVKLQGSSKLAQREQQNFEEFVRSIRFE